MLHEFVVMHRDGWGIEANRGTIEARNITGEGCVFALDLPRLTLPVLAAR